METFKQIFFYIKSQLNTSSIITKQNPGYKISNYVKCFKFQAFKKYKLKKFLAHNVLRTTQIIIQNYTLLMIVDVLKVLNTIHEWKLKHQHNWGGAYNVDVENTFNVGGKLWKITWTHSRNK